MCLFLLYNLNYFNHDYTSISIENDGDLLFAQSMAGYYSKINMPFLSNLKNEGYIAINDATLIISVSDMNGSFPLPETLLLYENSDNSELTISDFISSGTLNTNDNVYEFNITNYAQKVMDEEADTTCRLYTYSRSSNADRILLSNTVNNPIELKLLGIKVGD